MLDCMALKVPPISGCVAQGYQSGLFGEAGVCVCDISWAGTHVSSCTRTSVFGGASSCLWDPWVSACLHVLSSSALC